MEQLNLMGEHVEMMIDTFLYGDLGLDVAFGGSGRRSDLWVVFWDDENGVVFCGTVEWLLVWEMMREIYGLCLAKVVDDDNASKEGRM